jgi:DNA-binding IclR family transcriptional regulator
MSDAPLRTVARALELMVELERAGRPMALTELAVRLEEAPSVVHRMLRTLELAGRLTRDDARRYALAPAADPMVRARGVLRLFRRLSISPQPAGALADATGLSEAEAQILLPLLSAEALAEAGSEGWSLSPRVLDLVRPLLASDLAAQLRPVMERLRDTTGETVGLLLRTGEVQVLVTVVPSREQLRFSPTLGDAWPLTRGAGGKAQLMAMTDADLRGMILPEGSDPDALLAEIAGARARGWAQSVGERLPGVGAVAAPVPGAPGAVINVSFPAFRVPEDGIARFGAALAAEMAALDRVR